MILRLVRELNRQLAVGVASFLLPRIIETVETLEEQGREDSFSYQYLCWVGEILESKADRNI